MPTLVTDPDLLAQLNGSPTSVDGGPTPVTDPALLAQLNGTPQSSSLTDYLPKALTDIPSEIGNEFMGGAHDVAGLADVARTHADQGQLAGMMQTAQGALGPLRMLASPITGTARSVLGHGLAEAEHQAGMLINPKVAAQDDPAKMYEQAKSDVDRAMLAGAAETRVAAVPKTAELFEASNNGYRNMRGYGVEFHPQAVADVATNIMTELESEGYREYLTPKTFRAVDELNNPVGANPTISDVEGVRRALNKAAADPAERDAARRAVGQIDDFMSSLHPNDLVVNPQYAQAVAREAALARGNYAAAKRSELIDQAQAKAERQAGRAGSGANIDNALRQRISSILDNPKKLRGFSDAEKSQMEQIVKGTFTGNAARLIGKLAPTGVVSAGLSTGLGLATGLPWYVPPAVGFVAKKGGDLSTLRGVNRLSAAVRGRSPLGEARAATPLRPRIPPPLVPRVKQNDQ